VDVVELDRFTQQQSSELAAGELEPWGGSAEALSWREKDRHVGTYGSDGRLLAAAGSVVVEVEVDGAGAFAVLGIGGVFVTRDAREGGLVAPMLDALLVAPEDGAVDRAMLFCRPPLMALYRKSAFAEVSATVTVAQPDGRIEMPLRTMWRPLRDRASWPAGRVEVLGLPF
jgi:hypothetical protein